MDDLPPPNPPRRIADPAEAFPPPDATAAAVCAIAGKGRGVRATRALAPGEVIEAAPTIPLTPGESEAMEATPVGPYYFEHPLDPKAGLVVLGLTSIVNHADAPNAEIVWREEPGTGWFAVLRVVRPVAAGEEITHRYQCPPWFEVVG